MEDSNAFAAAARALLARGMAAFVLAAACLVGCSGDEPAATTTTESRRVCVPGQADPCAACGPGVVGVASCAPDGLSVGACACPTLTGSGGSAGVVGSGGAGGGVGAGGSPGGVGAGGDPGIAEPAGSGGMPAPPPPPDLRARGIRITEVAMYQAVKITLERDGEQVIARNAPVVVGKEAFVRVFVEPLAGFAPRELEVELTLTSSEAETMPLRVSQRIEGPSNDEDLGSTINFDVPPELIRADTRWAVVLHELDPAVAVGEIDPDVRYPASESMALEDLGARDAGPLRVMLVPYRYTADGSGRLPPLGEADLQALRETLYAYYPITEVQFEMHEPVDYGSPIGPNSGWEAWLDSHCTLRTQERPDPKLLYYGLIAPRASAGQYGSGVAGVSYVPGPAANYGRCSVGLGFSGASGAFVMAHELGHSLGLPHAPCGTSGGPFPYADAKIGSWGFGLSTRTLKQPDEFYDLMSYCDPVFISDYNYQKLFERIRYLNIQFYRHDAGATPQRYLRVLETSDGQPARVVGHSAFSEPPGGQEERRSVSLFDRAGAKLGVVEGYFLPTAEGDGGVWFIPDVGAHAVELGEAGRVAL